MAKSLLHQLGEKFAAGVDAMVEEARSASSAGDEAEPDRHGSQVPRRSTGAQPPPPEFVDAAVPEARGQRLDGLPEPLPVNAPRIVQQTVDAPMRPAPPRSGPGPMTPAPPRTVDAPMRPAPPRSGPGPMTPAAPPMVEAPERPKRARSVPAAPRPVPAPENVDLPSRPKSVTGESVAGEPVDEPVDGSIDEPMQPVPPRPPAKPPASTASPTPEEPGDHPGTQVAQLSAIFAAGPLRSRAVFGQTLAGRAVRWSGTVRSATPFLTDVQFGRTPGVRATMAVGEISVPGFGTLKINAVLQLPAGTELRSGQKVSFTGTLLQLDGLTRDIYISGATIVAT